MERPDGHPSAQLVERINRYFAAVDDKCLDLAIVESTFSSQGKMVRPNAAEIVGPAAICEAQNESFARFRATQHVMTNHVVTLEGERARVRPNIIAIHLWAPTDRTRKTPSCGPSSSNEKSSQWVSDVTDIEAAGSEIRSGRKVGPVTNSVIIRLKPGLSRDHALNYGTVLPSWGMPGPARGVPQPDIRDVFARHSRAIYSSHEPLAEAGVVVTAIGPSGFEGSAVIAARPELMNVITIGRHSNADLFLSQDPAMSLRQGAVIVYPHTNGEGVRFRILDLRAVRPFEDELGRQFEALEAEGPVFLRAGAYTLFVIPKEAGTPFCPDTAWEDLPERIHLEEAVLGHRRVSRIPNRMANAWNATVTLPLRGPVFDHERLLEDGEDPQGMLVVRSAQGEMRLLLGRTAASRGVLLGRYPRCDGGEMGILCDPAISRVHALVIEIAGSLYALDAGSTNGLWIGSDRVRMARLVPGLMVSLAGGGTIEWRLTP